MRTGLLVLSRHSLFFDYWCRIVRADGGQFFRGDVMEVKRIEIYDFKLALSGNDFTVLRDISDLLSCSVENAIIAIYLRGLIAMQAEFDKKG